MSHSVNTTQAIQRYCDIRHRLPKATHPSDWVSVETLDDLVDEFDLFVLDGFGVLNVGATPVPGAADRVNSLRAVGKSVVVLTNGATLPAYKTLEKYAGWGMAFKEQDVVSSRDALVYGMQRDGRDNLVWGVAATDFAQIDLLPGHCHLLEDDDDAYRTCDGFVLLSALDWTDARQHRITNAMQENPRPVLVGNPDLVAPHPERLSLEPGWFAHQLADELAVSPEFFGKPFGNAFDAVIRRFPGFDPQRIAMVGDSPHTDILGGAAAGWRTVLIQEHGLCKMHELNEVFQQTGICPDFVARTT